MSKQDRERLVERLRGRYAVGEGDPPEFGVRKFPVIPIQEEAADEIERLRAENDRLREIAECNDPGVVESIRCEADTREIGDERDWFHANDETERQAFIDAHAKAVDKMLKLSKGERGLTTEEQLVFGQGWKARADLDAEQRRELVGALEDILGWREVDLPEGNVPARVIEYIEARAGRALKEGS